MGTLAKASSVGGDVDHPREAVDEGGEAGRAGGAGQQAGAQGDGQGRWRKGHGEGGQGLGGGVGVGALLRVQGFGGGGPAEGMIERVERMQVGVGAGHRGTPGSCNVARSLARPAAVRDLTVPTGISRRSAISEAERPSK